LFGAGLKGGRGKGKEKEKVRKGSYKPRSKSEEGSSSSSSSSATRWARMHACAESGDVLDDMNVFNGLKKKRNVGSKRKILVQRKKIQIQKVIQTVRMKNRLEWHVMEKFVRQKIF
jgi:hypothetical protein